MNDLEINIAWEDPQGARGAELRATWARLTFAVLGKPVAVLHDYVAQSVRDGIYLPLYPLAEWITTHWWHLLYEVETPGRATRDSYVERHSLRFARDGFALPDLVIAPEGRTVRLEWRPLDLPTERVRFLQQGTAHLDSAAVRDGLRQFVTTVVERMNLLEISDTLLQEEWRAIEGAASDEAEFCRAAAALGLDPYAVDEGAAQAILSAGDALPESLKEDFFSVGEIEALGSQVARIQEGIQAIGDSLPDLTPLKELRRRIAGTAERAAAPWQTGYSFARDLRTELGGPSVRTMSDLSSAFRLREADLRAAMIVPEHNGCFFDALLAFNKNGSPGFVLDKRREDAQRFVLCRALYEFLASDRDAPALLTSSRSDRQKTSRAFAAEFLAPAEELRTRLRSDNISEDGIEDLAGEFNVSPYVVHHQIENHGLARVIQE